jgi:HPt (histidine-containing phosphotransfer) domain-containing protein
MPSNSAPTGPTLDLDSALARLGGDQELFAEMVGFLFEDIPKLHQELRSAVQEKNAPAIRMKAHALKGLVAGCGGVRATTIAQSLEDAGHSGNLNQANSLLESLNSELGLLAKALEAYRR